MKCIAIHTAAADQGAARSAMMKALIPAPRAGSRRAFKIIEPQRPADASGAAIIRRCCRLAFDGFLETQKPGSLSGEAQCVGLVVDPAVAIEIEDFRGRGPQDRFPLPYHRQRRADLVRVIGFHNLIFHYLSLPPPQLWPPKLPARQLPPPQSLLRS